MTRWLMPSMSRTVAALCRALWGRASLTAASLSNSSSLDLDLRSLPRWHRRRVGVSSQRPCGSSMRCKDCGSVLMTDVRTSKQEPEGHQYSQAGVTAPQKWWWRPVLFGEPAAIEVMSTIAAPLLAGFSITLLGVVAQAAANFRWPGIAMVLLLISAALLIMCVQCGFWARQYVVSREEASVWFADFAESSRQEQVRLEQVAFAKVYEGWARRAKRLYRFALLALLASLLVVLLPASAGDGSIQSNWRWAGVGIAALVIGFEVLWIVAIELLKSPFIKHVGPLERWLQRLVLPDARG
jgi:hypothetical protein